MTRFAASLFVSVFLLQAAVAAQSGAAPEPSLEPTLELPFTFDGPPVPVLPDLVSRDGAGRATLRAVRLTAPLRLDGRLDEAVYDQIPPFGDFIQTEPSEGTSATEKTEFWVFFDSERLYISFRCWESRPDALLADEMRRDNNAIFQNDHVAFILDTFYDRRNGVEFAMNAIGGRWDGQISNERDFNGDWNPVWDLETGRFDGGWTLEASIPFKSLRYRQGRAQIWGFNARRYNRWKNETSFFTRLPNAYGQGALFHTSLAATLVGLEVPSGAKNVDVKPYVVSSLTSDRAAVPTVSRDLAGDVGLDLKYGVTQNLTADFTYNTDFAQVEADEQQINLTRFSLFFPEKRDFFLENQGLFTFGGIATTPGLSTAASSNSLDAPILFYSRRIGFGSGRAVPIEVGGRLTGRAGRFSLGMLNIESNDNTAAGLATPAGRTNFSVVRIKRDVLRRSSVGLMFTGRSSMERTPGVANQVYGVDGTFAFFDNLSINTYWARSPTDGVQGDDTSYRAQLDYAGDRYGLQLEHLMVGDHFNPDVGFLLRDDIRKTYGSARFSPRPRDSKTIRKLSYSGWLSYIESGAGQMMTRSRGAEFGIELHNSDRFSLRYSDAYEFLPQSATILGLMFPTGGYEYGSTRVGYTFGRQHLLSGSVSAEYGDFYSGRKTSIGVSQGRVNLSPQLSFEPTYSGNWVDLVDGSSATHLVGSRVTYTMTPTMFTSALLQYNTGAGTMSANIRLRWEYRPGSELFVVYNDQRDTIDGRLPEFTSRALIIKVNRLFRF